MYKKVYFSEIFFVPEYYAGGVNIFDEKNRKLIKKINIDIGYNLSFSKLENVDYFLVKGTKVPFKVAIAKLKDFYIISFVNGWNFLRSNKIEAREDSNKNDNLLVDFAIKKVQETDKQPNIIYSKNYKSRAVIQKINNVFAVTYENLRVFDEMNFYFYENISSNNFYCFEESSEISYFDTFENAKKTIEKEITNNDEEDLVYYGLKEEK